MGLFVQAYESDRCWICGSSGELSREHKFKASDLRRHYGQQTMYVGDGERPARQAQGPNSKHMKFRSVICKNCNSAVTQASDRAYDRFVEVIEQSVNGEDAIDAAYSHINALEGREEYLSLFRYFAKLLGCHMADIGAPIPKHLSRFVATQTRKNCIWLRPRLDVDYAETIAKLDEGGPFAAHGGLVVITKRPRLLPTRLYTTSTVGRVQFIFYYVLTLPEVWEMRLRHPEFVRWCATTARAAIEEPIPDEDQRRLGFRD